MSISFKYVRIVDEMIKKTRRKTVYETAEEFKFGMRERINSIHL